MRGIVSAEPTYPRPLLPVTVTIGGNAATIDHIERRASDGSGW
jgi:hypothetical protein